MKGLFKKIQWKRTSWLDCKEIGGELENSKINVTIQRFNVQN